MSKKSSRDRFNKVFIDAMQSGMVMLKLRISFLDELTAEEKQAFRDFCDAMLICMDILITGETSAEKLAPMTAEYRTRFAEICETGNRCRR